MITAYLDESRHEERDKYMALAGFFGNEEQWRSFGPDWVSALGKRKSLHMSSLRLQSKPQRARKLLDRLGPLPHKHGLTPVHAALKVGDYLDLVQGTPQNDKFPGYCICLGSVMSAINWAVDPFESIKLVCEINKVYEDKANLTFRQVRIAFSKPERPYFSGIEFVPKNSTHLIEPSDFLAFAIAHHLEDPHSLKSELCRSIFGPDALIKGMTLNRDEIRQMMERVRTNMGMRWWKG